MEASKISDHMAVDLVLVLLHNRPSAAELFLRLTAENGDAIVDVRTSEATIAEPDGRRTGFGDMWLNICLPCSLRDLVNCII